MSGPRLAPSARRAVTFAGIAAGVAIALAFNDFGQTALAVATLATAAALSVLRDLVNQEQSR